MIIKIISRFFILSLATTILFTPKLNASSRLSQSLSVETVLSRKLSPNFTNGLIRFRNFSDNSASLNRQDKPLMKKSDIVGSNVIYDEAFKSLERRAARFWVDEKIHKAQEKQTFAPKKYILGMFPYPSGNAHLGHVRVFTIADVMARMSRFKGYNVLHPIGWDAFGLPAENAAIQNNVHPSKWTEHNIEKMRSSQLGELGFSFDLDHEINTSSPDYYRWTQWLFIQLYEAGLVYRSYEWVNWDPVDKTVLANEQVINGKGWRSDVPIERRKMEQWNIRITDFAEDLWNGLETLEEWPETAKSAQRNWIGRSEGVRIKFRTTLSQLDLEVFTAYPETIFEVAALLIAPEHDLVPKLTTADKKEEVASYLRMIAKHSNLERESSKETSGVFLGTYSVNPITGHTIPIYIVNYVLPSSGSGVLMCVPNHNARDLSLAERYNFKTYQQDSEEIIPNLLKGKTLELSRQKIISYLEENNLGYRSLHYRLKDWSISRQRFWGAPIPLRKKLKGNWEVVPDKQLPVRLPAIVDFSKKYDNSPLSADPNFQNYKDPVTGESFVRETDTLDTFMCSSWYIWRFLDPLSRVQAWSPEKAKYWMPVDIYVGGLEHANQHMIYLRFISHFLYSKGLTPVKEPIKSFLSNGMVRLSGTKMSKSKGNLIRPEDMVEKYGADALRISILSDTPYDRHVDWTEKGLKYKHVFLSNIYSFYNDVAPYLPKRTIFSSQDIKDYKGLYSELLSYFVEFIKNVDIEINEYQKFNVVIARLHSFFNTLTPYSKLGNMQKTDSAVITFILQNYLKALGLVAPHIAEILWRDTFEMKHSIFQEKWPDLDHIPSTKEFESLEVPLMINGKKKCTIKISNLMNNDDIIKAIRSYNINGDIVIKDDNIIIVRDKSSTNVPQLINIVMK
jgi:leucyl-tRNA synthetase